MITRMKKNKVATKKPMEAHVKKEGKATGQPREAAEVKKGGKADATLMEAIV